MIRLIWGLVAACLLGMATPASAQQLLNLSGMLQGSQVTIVCAIGDATCTSANGGTTATSSYEREFLQTLFVMNLAPGDNTFTTGSLTGIGLFSGTINNNNGVLTGRDLFYSYRDPGVPTGVLGSRTITATASSFAVSAVAPVPEPGTWAMMLLGFLGLGTALRRAKRPAPFAA